jgi:hypothetical protein
MAADIAGAAGDQNGRLFCHGKESSRCARQGRQPWRHCTIRLLCRNSASGEQARQVAARIMDAMTTIEASMIDHAASLPRSTEKAQRLLPDAHAAIANRSIRRRGQELSRVAALNGRLGRSEGIGSVSGRSQPLLGS